MKLLKNPLVTLLLFFLISTVYSQENVLSPKAPKIIKKENREDSYFKKYIFLGFEAGLNYNMYSQNLIWETPVPNSLFNAFGTGTGLSPYVSIMLDIPLSDNFGLQGRLSWDSRKFSNEYTGTADCQDPQTGLIRDAEENLKYIVTGTDIGLSILLRYNLSDDLFLVAGPAFLFPMTDYEQELTQTILSQGCFFDLAETQTVSVKTNPLTDVNSRFGLEFGAGYMIAISKNIFIVPQARFQYMLSTITDDETIVDDLRARYTSQLDSKDAKLHVVKIGLAIWFKL